MRLSFVLLLSVVGLSTLAPHRPVGRLVTVSTAEELVEALRAPGRDLVVELMPGVYRLDPTAGVDSSCGNCERPDTLIPMTIGLTVSGRSVRIVGPDEETAVIVTNSGYGLYFEHCSDCLLERVTITGGERDTSGAATDAAVVVKRSSVILRNVVVADNIGNPAVIARYVVGIVGICGREGPDVTIENCEIVRNSWDGVALYRDASAVIRNTLIDGVDGAGVEAGGGRGVAIGVTWNGRATIERNLIRNYWKGIGVFVDANVVASSNIVEQMRAWGIACWGADKGRPQAVIDENVVYDCGAFGIGIMRNAPFADGEKPGRLARNIVVHTAQNPKYDSPDYYGYQCALALHAVPDGFVIRSNTFYDNREASDSLFDRDGPREMFWRGRRGWVRKHHNIGVGVDGRHHFHESAFLTRYGRWLN